jgi:dienelactone hydrolase
MIDSPHEPITSAMISTSDVEPQAHRPATHTGSTRPFPAILMVSGCSGFTPSIAPQVYTRAAERWRSKGYVVVFVDYLSVRGLPNCRGLGAVNAVEIGKDVLAMARYLQGQPYVKASQISAVGWSLGGGAVLAALGQLTAAENRCQRRRENVSAGRSKTASRMDVKRPHGEALLYDKQDEKRIA